jgi:hypothetical protein
MKVGINTKVLIMDVLENYEMLYASKNEGKQSRGYILLEYFFFSLFFRTRN